MLLRASGEIEGEAVDLHAVTDPKAAATSGIAHAEELVAFCDAVVGDDDGDLETARKALLERVSPEQFVDAAAVASNFQRMVRIADSTGIPLDGAMNTMSGDLRDELGLEAFGSSANTKPAGALRRAAGRALRPLFVPVVKLATRGMRNRS